MRHAKPWFRSQNATWYVWHKGKQIPLTDPGGTERDAWAVYHRLMANEGQLKLGDEARLKFYRLADAFLGHCDRHQARATYTWHKRHIDSFCRVYRGSVWGMKVADVTGWLDAHPQWGDSSRRGAIISIKRVLNWGVCEGHISKSPLLALKRPKVGRRKSYITNEQRRLILGATKSQRFRDLLNLLWWTGCRPQEARAIDAAHVDLELGAWHWEPAEAPKRTGKPRTVILCPKALRLTRVLMSRNPQGPLLRNDRGEPWTGNAIRCRFRAIREKGLIPKGFVAYSMRHGRATSLLVGGATNHDVATILGHASTNMVDEVYSHLVEEVGHLRTRLES